MTFDGTYWLGPFQWAGPSIPDKFPFFDAHTQHPVSISNPGSIPGPANASAVRRYTASELAGPTSVTIAGTYQDVDTGGGDSVIFRIFIDGVLKLADGLADDGGAPKSFSFNVTLLPTSIVDFEVDPKNGFLFDRTLVTATVSTEAVPVPELSSALLFVSALQACSVSELDGYSCHDRPGSGLYITGSSEALLHLQQYVRPSISRRRRPRVC